MSPEEERNHDAGPDLELSEPEEEESADEVNDSESDSDEEEEEDEEVDIGRHAKKKFDKFIADIKEGKLILDGKDDIDAFLQKHEDILGKRSSPKDQNLLHLLADAGKDELPYKKIKGLVEALIKSTFVEGDLLAQQDSDHKTPLYIAISLRNHRLAKLMCETHPDIDRVIRIKPKGLGNSLHLALRNKKSSKDDELATTLINSSSQETLCAKDESRLTPLHLAVDYKRCDAAQVGIVKAIVERCPTTLDQTYEHKGKGLLSPYRYHELTYQEALEKAAREPKKTDKKEGSIGHGQQSSRSIKELAPSKRRPVEATIKPATAQPARRVPGKPDSAPTGKFGSAAPKSAAVEGPKPGQLSRTKTEGRLDGTTDTMKASDANDKPAASQSHKKESKTKTKSSAVTPTEESSRKIKNYLKLYCLRTKKHDDAIEFLYGVQQDRQIYFDLFGAGPSLSQSRMQDGLKHLEFEDILQYVAVPQVRIEGNPVVVKSNKPPPKPDAKGRDDLNLLFHWLKDDNQKKVKTILKVIVDDLQEPAHHDEAIEECLDGLGVEVWDWRKMDISPDVIKKVAPGAREIHLYWSGNNAVLRGWGEAEALRELKKLEKVYLHAHQGLETRSRSRQYTDAFKQRLEGAIERKEGNKMGLKPIQVFIKKSRGDTGDSGAAGVDALKDPYERHRWIQTMEDFADFLQTAERNADPPVALTKPVLVAVIDDGVDINDASVQSRVIAGRSFCHRDEEQNLNQPYYVSSSGHGTAMAGLICKLCPNVRLFVLKLDERPGGEAGKRSITAKSAAKAVRAAVEQKVDIISMSWTIERTDTNKADIDELEKAIELAASQNVLMFCAATDQGPFKDRSYPAASGTKRIFKIGAAEASGAALKWVGDQSAVDFIMPGHQVVMERHNDPSVQKFTPLTGSSVATALASGLAAVILYCVQLGGIVRADGNQREETREFEAYCALKTHERMREAIQQIGGTRDSDYKYITVWSRFAKPVKKAEMEMRDRWINLVADLAEELKREV